MIKFSNFMLKEGILNPAFAGDEEVKKLDNWIDNPSRYKKDKEQITNLMVDVFGKYEKLLNSVKKKFESLIRKELRKFKKARFLSDAKSMESIINKAVDRGRGFGELNDLVRGAILLETKADADAFVDKFMRRNKSIVVGYEEKKRGEDNTYGYYGSHHIDLNIDGLIVELQIMTKKLWQYKEEAHKIYMKNRAKEDGPDNFDKYTSKKIFSIANMKSESIAVDDESPKFTIDEMVDFGQYTEVNLLE